jgi:hypothetical protein
MFWCTAFEYVRKSSISYRNLGSNAGLGGQG